MQGILLAAGVGRRFQSETDPQPDKLLVRLSYDNKTILWHSAKTLMTALPNSIAVVQPHQTERIQILQSLGFLIVESKRAEHGMGYAIADAVVASEKANGWLIALADMPWVTAELILKLSAHVTEPTSIVAPRFNDKRGQPIAFGAAWREHLRRLEGDIGARELLKTASINWIDWHDDSIHRDVDTIKDITF